MTMFVLCCLCGIPMEANEANMCVNCLSSQVDISEGISTECSIIQCRTCLRYQRGTLWTDCGLESQELMAICLKKINGLNKKSVQLMDADFIWTEPHSKRLKVKLTIRKEALNNAHLQKVVVVTFIVSYLKCTECSKQFHNAMWKSQVQIRQKVNHKRTFYRLEQQILAAHAHDRVVDIESKKDGMDFFFGEKNSAERFLSFLSGKIPYKTKHSSKLISSDNHNNTANIRNTYVVEIVPICKDDLVVLPKKVAQQAGSISRLVIVSRITSQIHIVDPVTNQKAEISADKFWRNPFEPLESSLTLIDFVVLDVEPVFSSGHEKLSTVCDIELARARDFGENDTTFLVRSHLGAFLNSGDTVKGYDLSTANYSYRVLPPDFRDQLIDIVLVRKVYPKSNSRQNGNASKLKTLGAAQSGKISKNEAKRLEEEYEAFAVEFVDEQKMAEMDEKMQEIDISTEN